MQPFRPLTTHLLPSWDVAAVSQAPFQELDPDFPDNPVEGFKVYSFQLQGLKSWYAGYPLPTRGGGDEK